MLDLLVHILSMMGMGLIGLAFKAVVEELQKHGFKDVHTDQIQQWIDSAELNTALATPRAKYDWVFAQFKAQWPEMAESAIDAVISAIVRQKHAGG